VVRGHISRARSISITAVEDASTENIINGDAKAKIIRYRMCSKDLLQNPDPLASAIGSLSRDFFRPSIGRFSPELSLFSLRELDKTVLINEIMKLRTYRRRTAIQLNATLTLRMVGLSHALSFTS